MNYLLICIACLLSGISSAQEIREAVPEAPTIKKREIPQPTGEEVIEFPDVEAQFPGGNDSLRYFIATNVVYPEIALQNGDQGRVYVSFIIEKDGSISDINIMRGVSLELDREAKRLIRSMPNWIPAEFSGKTVRSYMRLPILFVLEKEK